MENQDAVREEITIARPFIPACREPIAGRVTGRQNFVHLDRTEVETSLADVDQAHCMLEKTVLFAKLRLWI